MQRFTLNRRQMLGGLAAGAGLSLLGPMGRASAAVSEIVWATWDSNGHPEYVATFEKATGTKVKLSFLSSEDAQFAALKTGSASDWDIVNPSLNGAWRYIKAKVLKPLDLSKVPNIAHMYDVFKTTDKVKGEDGATYAIPYLWGLNPIVYRSDIHTEEPTYSTLFDPKFKGQLAMRDYALESIAIAALHIGIPRERAFLLTSDELAEVKKALIAQKPLLRTYWQTIGDLTNLFATGEVTACLLLARALRRAEGQDEGGDGQAEGRHHGLVRLLRPSGQPAGRKGGDRLQIRRLSARRRLCVHHRRHRQLRHDVVDHPRQAEPRKAGSDLRRRPLRDAELHVAGCSGQLLGVAEGLERGQSRLIRRRYRSIQGRAVWDLLVVRGRVGPPGLGDRGIDVGGKQDGKADGAGGLAAASRHAWCRQKIRPLDRSGRHQSRRTRASVPDIARTRRVAARRPFSG